MSLKERIFINTLCQISFAAFFVGMGTALSLGTEVELTPIAMGILAGIGSVFGLFFNRFVEWVAS